MTTSAPRALLRPVPAAEVQAALSAALQGGPPIAPLAPVDPERSLSLEMLALERPVDADDVVAVVSTSGSTGRPKGVVLSRTAVTASVTATHARLGGAGDWVLALPPHYVAGLMVLARAVLGGTTVQHVSSDLRELPAAVRAMTGRRYLSVVPTQLRRACAVPELAAALARFHTVLLGGAAPEPALLARARDLGITVVTTYGMSETCGGCVYDGRPLDGVDVRLEPGSQRVQLGGPVLFSGYRLRPDLTADSHRDGWFVTSDRGGWVDGRLSVLGRVDDVVVSGGVNVDLAAVEAAARSWPGLAGAEIAVIGVPDAEWGTAVVAVTDGSGSEADLRSYLRMTLSAAAAPRRLARLSVLPRTSSGKIDRRRLVDDLATAGSASTGAADLTQSSHSSRDEE